MGHWLEPQLVPCVLASRSRAGLPHTPQFRTGVHTQGQETQFTQEQETQSGQDLNVMAKDPIVVATVLN